MRKISLAAERQDSTADVPHGREGGASLSTGAGGGTSEADKTLLRSLALEYRRACIDLARTGINGMRQKLLDERLIRAREALVAPHSAPLSIAIRRPQRRLTLKEEMPHAVRVYDELTACVRRLMASADRGLLDISLVASAVEGLIASLERNPDALVCLPRLRQRDAYTYAHCANVAIVLAAYAMHTGESRNRVVTFALAGLFHDLGKALLPVSLLNARRRLSATEQTLVTRHPELGCDLLLALPDLHPEVILAALEHHERYDGSGYPKGLSRDAISEIGHVCGIADTYDAISSRRPYRGGLFPHRTLGVMYQMRKKQFHPLLLEKFVRVVGIYPVGSVVELEDGYRGVVSAGNYANPMQPVIALALDPAGNRMPRHDCDLAREGAAAIARCLPPELSGVEPCQALGLLL